MDVLVMAGLRGESQAEDLLNEAWFYNSLDLIERAREAAGVGQVVLSTNSEKLARRAATLQAEVVLDEKKEKFHFGLKLQRLVKKYRFKSLLYLGGGSAPLLKSDDFAKLDELAAKKQGSFSIANNFYSPDFIFLSPADKILEMEPPERDNSLGWISRRQGLSPHELTRCGRTLFDIDCPTDLKVLKITGRASDRLGEYVSSLRLDLAPLEKTMAKFREPSSRLVMAGRIGAATWRYLEKEAACRINLLSEGRGAKARGGGPPPFSPFLSSFYELAGPRQTLRRLSKSSDGLFIDTRVIYHGKSIWPKRSDRFWADLGEVEKIENPLARELAAAVNEVGSEVAVIAGGHSLLCGSLYLLNESAWQGGEREKLIRPGRLSL